MNVKFIAVSKVNNLETVMVNVSHIIEIYELKNDCSFLVFSIDGKERGLRVNDSVDFLFSRLDIASQFVELITVDHERVFVNISHIITIYSCSEDETFIELKIKRGRSYGLRIAKPIRSVLWNIDYAVMRKNKDG